MSKHTIRTILFLCLVGFFMNSDSFGQLITQPQARHIGLTRKWTAQATMNSARSTLRQLLFDHGTLFSLTDTGLLQAYNAETGATLWTVQVGERALVTSEMDVSKNYVTVMNGSTIYVLNRFNGKLLWTGEADVIPGAGPAISDSRVYVPGMNGRMQSFALRLISDALREFGKDEKTLSPEEREKLEVERRDSMRIDEQFVEPLNSQSSGKIFMQPVITRSDTKEDIDNIVWIIDTGDLYMGSIRTTAPDKFPVKFIVDTGKDISSKPTFIEYERKRAEETGRIYLASRDGYVYCVREMDGEQMWTYPCNEPIIEHLAVVSWSVLDETKKDKINKTKIVRRVYVPTYQRGLFCLDAVSGEKIWQTPGIKRFLSQSGSRIYTVDYQNNLTVLDLNSGQVLGALPLKSNTIQYLNEINDRIYLASETGMIQCLAQLDLEKPIYFRQDPEPPKESEIDLGDDDLGKKRDNKEQADEEETTVDGEPAADGDADATEEPGFGGDDATDDTADDTAEEDNPFGAAPGDDAADESNPFGDDDSVVAPTDDADAAPADDADAAPADDADVAPADDSVVAPADGADAAPADDADAAPADDADAAPADDADSAPADDADSAPADNANADKPADKKAADEEEIADPF